MTNWVCLNGEHIPEEQAAVPVTDRGFLFGDGLFSTLRVHDGEIEFFQAHLQRLFRQCVQLNIQPPLIKLEWIKRLIEYNQAEAGTWRLKIVITGGREPALHLPNRLPGLVLLTLKPFQLDPFTPCRLGLFPDPVVRPLAAFKTLAYLDRLSINDYAQTKGYDDVIVFNCEGYLLETAFSNLFWLDDDHLFMPDPALPYLQGIMVKQLMSHLGFKVQPVKAGLEDIPFEASVYTCNSLTHIRPVIEIDRRLFTRQPLLEERLGKTIRQALQNDLA